MPGTHPHVGESATIYQNSPIHGITQGKKQSEDFRPTRELKIQIRKQKLLVQRVVRRYGGTESAKLIAENMRNQLEEDYAQDQASIKEYIDPFTGSKTK